MSPIYSFKKIKFNPIPAGVLENQDKIVQKMKNYNAVRVGNRF